MKKPSFPALTAVLGLLLAPPLALAHVHLVSSTPANGSVVANAPGTLQLKFSEAARVTALGIRRTGEAALQKLGPLPNQAVTQLSIAAPALSPGAYVVTFRALDPGDGHISGGTFRFTVRASMRDTGTRPVPATIK
jgi:copper resistance protein C